MRNSESPHHEVVHVVPLTATNASARQLPALLKRNGFELVGEHYDAAVSGADPIETRPGFKALLDRIEGNGVRVVIGGSKAERIQLPIGFF